MCSFYRNLYNNAIVFLCLPGAISWTGSTHRKSTCFSRPHHAVPYIHASRRSSFHPPGVWPYKAGTRWDIYTEWNSGRTMSVLKCWLRVTLDFITWTDLCCIFFSTVLGWMLLRTFSLICSFPTNLIICSFAAGSLKPPEDTKVSAADNGTPSDACTDNQLGSPAAPGMLSGPGVMQGPRPGMPPLQHPPGMPNPHLPPFLPPPNMPHMPPQMMPGGPMFPPDRFRMPMPFPPRGPPFHRPPMRPEGMDDRDGRHFRNGRPGFACPPFPRGRW